MMILIAILTLPAQAEEALPIYDIYVTSSRDLVEQVETIRRVDRQDIGQENARTLDEALVHVPNVVVRTGGDGVPRIDVRGLRSRHLMLLVDGIPYNSTADGQFDASLIPTQLIDRIDLVTGNSSVLYGDGGIGGVLQIRTRKPSEALEATVSADVRERGQYQPEATVGGLRGAFEGFAAGRYLDAKGYPLPSSYQATSVENGCLRQNSDRQQGNAFAKLGYRLTPTSRIDLLADYRRAEFGVPPNTVDDPGDRFAARTRYERVEELEGFSTQLAAQFDPDGPLSLRAWGFVNRQEEDRRRYDDAGYDSISQNGSFSIDETALLTGGAAHGRYDLAEWGALRFAINGRYEDFDASGIDCVISGGGGGGGGGGGSSLCGSGGSATPFTRVDTDEGIGVWSLGAEYETQPIEGLGLVLGYSHAFLEGNDGIDDDASIFLAGATYELATDTRLRGSVAHKIRMPSVLQLYDPESGNTDLDTERCWCFEAAIEQTLPYGSSVELVGFWQELTDFIERDESRIFQNRQKLRLQGVELSASTSPIESLVLRFAYAYLHTEDRSDDRNFSRLANRPEHTIDFEARYTHPWNGDLRLGLRHLRGIEEDSRNAPFELQTLGEFTTVDVRVAQRLMGDRFELYVGLDNLFDEEGAANLGFPIAGRTVLGGGSFRF